MIIELDQAQPIDIVELVEHVVYRLANQLDFDAGHAAAIVDNTD